MPIITRTYKVLLLKILSKEGVGQLIERMQELNSKGKRRKTRKTFSARVAVSTCQHQWRIVPEVRWQHDPMELLVRYVEECRLCYTRHVGLSEWMQWPRTNGGGSTGPKVHHRVADNQHMRLETARRATTGRRANTQALRALGAIWSKYPRVPLARVLDLVAAHRCYPSLHAVTNTDIIKYCSEITANARTKNPHKKSR